MKIRSLPILKVEIDPLNYPRALRKISLWIKEKRKTYVCVANVHLIMECQKDGKLLKGVNSAGLITPDGMPLVWLLKLYGKKTERVYGPTLMIHICGLAQRHGYKIFLLGGLKGLTRKLKQSLLKTYPRIKIVGGVDTPQRSISEDKNEALLRKINQSSAQIVFVGMGCPYQELWMIKNRAKLNANILIGVGAAFDYFSGRRKQAPNWMQKIGFEWLFRFLQEPVRLWRRYTLVNFEFVYKILVQVSKDFLFSKTMRFKFLQ